MKNPQTIYIQRHLPEGHPALRVHLSRIVVHDEAHPPPCHCSSPGSRTQCLSIATFSQDLNRYIYRSSKRRLFSSPRVSQHSICSTSRQLPTISSTPAAPTIGEASLLYTVSTILSSIPVQLTELLEPVSKPAARQQWQSKPVE